MTTNINSPSCWDPSLPNRIVRMRASPGRRGVTTGRIKDSGSYVMVEVEFGPNEKSYKRYHLLELVTQDENLFDLFYAGKFGGVDSLRQILTYEKVKGELTNIYYSMESSNTTFYPHQFKPVLKFIESADGRLLIADEVGLGKTIEAVYIWKELQARNDARRLLIVCPAMLREKWQHDLLTRFNASANIVSAKDLLKDLNNFVQRGRPNSFLSITSLEGLRTPAKFEDDSNSDVRAQIARLLEQHSSLSESALFDLVIIDEAHYLRNVSTASNRLGRLLRDASNHLLLLTATPIHIHNDNLYQLLRLIDQDKFRDASIFTEMLEANKPIVTAQRALWQSTPDIDTALKSVEKALSNEYFHNDSVLIHLKSRLREDITADSAIQVECARMLESRSLLSQYITRTRKRETDVPRAERQAQALEVKFTDMERTIYSQITDKIAESLINETGVQYFALIMRLRQMASSLVATLKYWQDTEFLEELLWEDIGRSSQNLTNYHDSNSQFDFFDVEDIDVLEKNDSKFEKLKEFLLRELKANSREKFVVFAYFRATLEYLAVRLQQVGIEVSIIMGGMNESKYTVLSQFSEPNGPSVLLSSEVGSEGIDLQFCRFLINYDLPWNPMRVEQRIGRIDRLGQKAETISIINFFVADTIEEYILRRLYDRLGLFRETIGDLEEILGEQTETLLLELLDPKLSDQKRQERLQQAELAISNQREQQKNLEDQAINLIGFSKYIFENIKNSRDNGRWVSADELASFVDDFFKLRYPGTSIHQSGKSNNAARLQLSLDAKVSLSEYVNRFDPAIRTNLSRSSKRVLCHFDTHRAHEILRRETEELIEAKHPLIQWICHEYETNDVKLYPIAAITVKQEQLPYPIGDYVYVVEKWSFVGLRSEIFLAFKVVCVGHSDSFDAKESEKIVTSAAKLGTNFSNAQNLVSEFSDLKTSINQCENALTEEFGNRMDNFEAENNLKCRQQEISARNYSDRQISEFRERIEQYRVRGQQRIIPMTEGKIEKVKQDLNRKLLKIESYKEIDPTSSSVAVGLIRID